MLLPGNSVIGVKQYDTPPSISFTSQIRADDPSSQYRVEKDMPCTAAEVDGLFRQLAIPSFEQVLAANHKT
jgi:hypothetical protein